MKINSTALNGLLKEADELSKILARSVLTMKENQELVSSKV